MLPLASLSGAPSVRTSVFLPQPVSHSAPLLFVPQHVPGFPGGDRGLDLSGLLSEVGGEEKERIENNSQGSSWTREEKSGW